MIKPMLSGKIDFSKLVYPVFVSPKIDGIRCVIEHGRPMSRTAKELPNRHLRLCVQEAGNVLELLDGEIVVGPPSAPEVYNRTMSGIMSQTGVPNLRYLVFDHLGSQRSPYTLRLETLQKLKAVLPPWVEVLPQTLCQNQEEVEHWEEKYVSEGYEGIIVRSPSAQYKQGRSTAKEGYLLKLKRYDDTEAIVIGFEELMRNENEAFTDVQGHTKHTSHQAGQRAGGVLGALVVNLMEGDGVSTIRFKIGTGFDLAQRRALWVYRDKLPGKIVKFRYLPHGMLESTGVPRHPSFLGWRDPIDL